MKPIWVQAYYGGNWNNGANAGLGALNLNNPASNANSNIGARPAKDIGQKPSDPRMLGQHSSFGACILSPRLEDQQPRAASNRKANAARGPRERNMPKTYNGLYDRIIGFDNLAAAYEEAKRGKRYTPEALAFAAEWEARLIDIHEHLKWRTWRPGAPRVFTVTDPKRRDITAPPFADRVVHHALVRVVEPLFERRFIHDSYACRAGKGTHAAVQRGVDFCGYRIWPTHILPRKRNTKRWRTRLRALSAQYADGAVTLDECRQMVASCIAYHAHANARRTLDAMLSDFTLSRPCSPKTLS